MESDYSGDLKESFIKEKMNTSAEKNKQICLDQFCSFRRKTRPFIEGEDKFNKLPDEMILMIFKWLPRECLARSMLVCKRWCQIARDKALWTRVVLNGFNELFKLLNEGTLGLVLSRGVQILKLEYVEIADPIFCEGSEVFSDSYISKLEYLTSRLVFISPVSLAALLSKCKYLKELSLEYHTLNRDCCRAISQNSELEALHLIDCQNIDIECIMDLTKLKCLTALDMSYCCLNNECMTLLCRTLPISITNLLLSYHSWDFQTMTDENVEDLTKSCPNLIKLVLYHCQMLTMRTVDYLLNLSKLRFLTVLGCYGIPISGHKRLSNIPGLLDFYTHSSASSP